METILKYYSLIFILIFTSHSTLISQKSSITEFYNLFAEAQTCSLFGKLDSALVLLQKAIDTNPTSGTANYAIAKIYFEQKSYYLALPYALQATTLSPKNIWYLKMLRDIYFQTHQDAEFIAIQQKILNITKIQDDYLQAFNYYQLRGYFDEITACYDKYNKLFPQNLQITSFFLNAAYKMDNKKLVYKYADDIIKNYKYNTTACLLLIKYYLLFDDKKAVKNMLSDVLKYDSTKFEINLIIAEVYLSENQYDSSYFFIKKTFTSNDFVVDKFLETISQNEYFNPVDFAPYFDTVTSYLTANYQENKMLNIVLAENYMNNNFFYDAIKFYEKSISKNFVDFDIYLNLLNLYSKFKNWRKLDSIASVVTEIFPMQPYIYLFKSMALLNLHKYPEAFKNLKFGTTIIFDDTTLKAYYNFYLFVYYSMTKNSDEANFYLNKTLDIAQHDCDLLAYFALYLSSSNIDNHQALTIINTCMLEQDADLSDNFLFVYAYILYKMSDMKTALINVNSAIQFSEKPNFIYYQLKANIFSKIGNLDSAQIYKIKSVNSGNLHFNDNL